MDDSALSTAIIEASGHTAGRHVDGEKTLSLHGSKVGSQMAPDVLAFVRKWNWR